MPESEGWSQTPRVYDTLPWRRVPESSARSEGWSNGVPESEAWGAHGGDLQVSVCRLSALAGCVGMTVIFARLVSVWHPHLLWVLGYEG